MNVGCFQSHATRRTKKRTRQWSCPSQCVRKQRPRRRRRRSAQQSSRRYRRRPPSRIQPSRSGGKPGWRKPAAPPPSPAGPTTDSTYDGKPPSHRYSAFQKLPAPVPKTCTSRRTYPCHARTCTTQSRRPKQGPQKPTAPRISLLGQ